MLTLGLTGGIACGKSNVSDTLAELGAVVIDGDLLSRRLTAPGGPALPGLRAEFGSAVFQPDGSLDRRALGALVFSQPEAMERLNALMQPLLRQLIEAELSAAGRSGAAVCVLSMPLLYEQGLDRLCQRVWCVWLPPQEQLRRLMERDGFSREQAQARIDSQLPVDEKARRADVVIDTSGPIAYTKSLIPPLLQEELRRSARPAPDMTD